MSPRRRKRIQRKPRGPRPLPARLSPRKAQLAAEAYLAQLCPKAASAASGLRVKTVRALLAAASGGSPAPEYPYRGGTLDLGLFGYFVAKEPGADRFWLYYKEAPLGEVMAFHEAKELAEAHATRYGVADPRLAYAKAALAEVLQMVADGRIKQ